MKTQEWLALARAQKDKLRSLIAKYHPAGPHEQDDVLLPITAQAPEATCETFRQEIAAKGLKPLEKFDKAIAEGDCVTLESLLNEAWIGVPESTSCWSIVGFSEAVNLMEDPPCDDEEEPDLS